MKTITPAKGNITRQANKKLRRKRIMDTARQLIANNGYEAFTISELALEANVSAPTIHNLLGKKQDILVLLVSEMVELVDAVMSKPSARDPIEGAEIFIDNLLGLFKKDEVFYRAAFVTGERTQLFEHELPGGIYNQSLKIAEQICAAAKTNGFLKGDINTALLAEQLFGCQRLARQDWVNGYIDLEHYRTQVLVGMLTTYAADATPDFHTRLCKKIKALNRGK